MADAKRVLGDEFVGLYVHGSLALQDFNPGRSDIDFVVVTNSEVSEALFAALKDMHAAITSSGLPYADRLEGCYISKDALPTYVKSGASYPAVQVGGEFGMDGYGAAWEIEKWVLREHGIVLAGPDPKTLLPEITAEHLRFATGIVLEYWWGPQITDHQRLVKSDYQVYAVMTMCRIQYTVKTGTVGSKSQAVAWAKSNLDPKWSALIGQAADWQLGDAFDHLPEITDLIAETLRNVTAPDAN